MHSTHEKAMDAARRLATSMSLPSYQGTVFVWHDTLGEKIVVCAESAWLSAHHVPKAYDGFRVETQDAVTATFQRRV